MKKNIIFVVLIILAFSLLLLGSCEKDEEPQPDLNSLPELEQIPYDRLGSGKIVFKRIGPNGGQYEGIYVIDLNQKKSWSFSPGLFGDCNISPDGKYIAFEKFNEVRSANDIYIVNIDGSELQKITSVGGSNIWPSWSQDGEKIFFWNEVNLVSGSYFSLYNQSRSSNSSSATNIMKLTFQTSSGEYFAIPSGPASISSSGKITFVINSAPNLDVAGLYTINSNGENMERIVAKDKDRYFKSPVFSNDGKKIAYLSALRTDDGNYQKIDIMVLDLESTVPDLLISIPASGKNQWNESPFIYYVGYEVNLTWSPDGSKLLLNVPQGDFVSYLYVLNSDGSGITQLTSQQGVTDRCVSWGR